MEKLYIWFNPAHNSFILNWCRSLDLLPGYINSHGHQLIEVFECLDGILQKQLTRYQRQKRIERIKQELRNKHE